ncbi:MAG: hypothetical protein ACOWWH_12610 [Eubacteriaceae bacterium]
MTEKFKKDISTSKAYKTREKCELALAEYIANKYNKVVIDSEYSNVNYIIETKFTE